MTVLLDASAVLAVLFDEAGAAEVEAALGDATISAVNLAETAAKLSDRGASPEDARAVIEALGLAIRPFDPADALASAALRPATRAAGLSLGDRACLATGKRMGVPVLTADPAWADLTPEIEVRIIR